MLACILHFFHVILRYAEFLKRDQENGPRNFVRKQKTMLVYVSYNHFLKCFFYDINEKWLPLYEGWNFNSGNYLFTTDTK